MIRVGCERARDLYDEALDDRIDESERSRLERHLSQCPECRRYCEGISTTRQLLASVETPSLPPARVRRLRARLEAHLAAEPRDEASSTSGRRLRWVLVAAALVVVGGAGVGAAVGARSNAPPQVNRVTSTIDRARVEPRERAALAAPHAPAAPARREVATVRVAAVDGEASHRRRAGGARPLASESTLEVADRIVTAGAEAVVSLEGGVSIALDADSALAVEATERDRLGLRLERGRMVGEVDPETSERALEIVAERARVRVTGTIFSIDARRQGAIEVHVLRGHVQVVGDDGVVHHVGAMQRLALASGALTRLGREVARRDRALLGEGREGGRAPAMRERDVEDLFRRAEAARRGGDRARALALYRRIASLDPGGPSGGTALITIGQMSASGSPALARRAYRQYLASHRRGPLRQEAFEGLMRAEVALGQRAAARSTARRYLREFRNGRYAERARDLLTIGDEP